TAAIAGIPGLAGYFSKDEILGGAFSAGWNVLFGIGLIVAGLTAFYMTRAVVMTFLGTYRGPAETGAHVPESPWVMLGPLVVLAVGSAAGGYVGIPDFVKPAFRLETEAHEAPHPGWLPIVASTVALVGIAIAVYMFLVRTELPQ